MSSSGVKLFFFDNGSAADAGHPADEFVGRFVEERRGLPAVALTTDSSIVTAVGNDDGFDQIFSQKIEVLGNPGDVAIGHLLIEWNWIGHYPTYTNETVWHWKCEKADCHCGLGFARTSLDLVYPLLPCMP
jgi:hypothetical protein